jgi:lysophospholipase L1-like esterase
MIGHKRGDRDTPRYDRSVRAPAFALVFVLGCNATPAGATTAVATPSGESQAAVPRARPDEPPETPMAVHPPVPGDAPARAASIDLPSPPADLVPIPPDSTKKEKVSKTRQRKLDGFAAEDLAALQGRTVLLGDSITSMFPTERLLGKYGVVNRGIGGDTIGLIHHRGVYERLETTVYNLDPVRIILMIGTNDLLYSKGTLLETKQKQYEHLVWKIRHDKPDVELFCVSVLPARGGHAPKNPDIVAFNRAMAEAVPKYGARWIEVHDVFADPTGQLREDMTRDGVHLNSRAYERLTEIYAREIFGEDERPEQATR